MNFRGQTSGLIKRIIKQNFIWKNNMFKDKIVFITGGSRGKGYCSRIC